VGIGTAACFVFDPDGKPIHSDILAGEAVILDSGVHTLDALKMVDGNFNPEMPEHADYWDPCIEYRGTIWSIATIEDLMTRQIMAQRLGKRHDSLVLATLRQALATEFQPQIFHSDQGNEFMLSAVPIIWSNTVSEFQSVMGLRCIHTALRMPPAGFAVKISSDNGLHIWVVDTILFKLRFAQHVTNSLLGLQIARTIFCRLKLAAQTADIHPQILLLLLIFRPPDAG
jgi:hypothetical protein